MSNARDKANIPALNFSSTGIDDNATSTAITINSSQNVGIGAAVPSSQLTVGSGGTANPTSIAQIHSITTDKYFLKLTSNNFNVLGNWIGLGIGYSSNYLKSAIIAEAQDGQARTKLHFCSNASTLSTNASISDKRMSIDYNGDISFYEDTGTTPQFFWDASAERLGIGTANPQNKLDISAITWNDGITIKNTGNFNTAIIGDANRTVAGGGIFNLAAKWNGTEVASILFEAGSDTTNKDDGAINFRTASAGSVTERMRIDSSGNLGIGTTDINTNGISLSRTQGGITRAFGNPVTDYVEFTGELVHATGSGVAFGTQDMIQINFPAPTFSSVFFDIQIMSYTANTGNSATQGSMWRFVFTRDNDGDNANSITEYSTTSVLAGDADPNISLSGSFSSNVFTLKASQQTGGISHLNFKVTGFVTRVDSVYASDGQTNVSWDSRKKLVYDS